MAVAGVPGGTFRAMFGPLGVPKRFRGIGIRIEDDVAVTRTGFEVLTAKAPKDPDEIEDLMAHG